MPKVVKELGALEVKRISEPGFHAVGTVSGLYLNVKPSGAKSWILRAKVGKSRSEIGLGGYPTVTLAQAWERAREALTSIREGKNPIAERKSVREAIEWTFKACALSYIETHRPSWRNAKHAQQWENTLTTYVYPHFGHKHVSDVDTDDVLAAIKKEWSTKNETMVRVRNRIELVLAWAAAQGHRPKGFNPAQWRGHLDQVLPKPSKVNNRKHFEAVPINSMYDFMQRLELVKGISARCLEFTVLCACRSGMTRGALWSEIDLKAALWSIPGSRMKAGRPFRIPLSERAVKILEKLPRTVDASGQLSDLVFVSNRGIKPLSNMSMTLIMRRMGLTAVPHGFRSSFTDWVSEHTHYPRDVREMALAHAIGDETEEAYRRGDLFEKRRNMLNDWANFVYTPPPEGNNVVPFKAA